MSIQQTAHDLLRVLDRAILLLVQRRVVAPGERQQIDIDLVHLNQERARIDDLITSSTLPVLTPPTNDDVARVSAVAQQLDNVSASNTTASAIVNLVRGVSNVLQT